MERKTKVPLAGSGNADATIIDITSSQENWNQYLLSDGTVLKLKVVATECVRIDGQYDNEGNPVYLLKSSNVLSAIVPDTLKKH